MPLELFRDLMTQYPVDDLNSTVYAQVVEELQGNAVTRHYSYGLERISETQPIDNVWTTSFYSYDGGGSVRALHNFRLGIQKRVQRLFDRGKHAFIQMRMEAPFVDLYYRTRNRLKSISIRTIYTAFVGSIS